MRIKIYKIESLRKLPAPQEFPSLYTCWTVPKRDGPERRRGLIYTTVRSVTAGRDTHLGWHLMSSELIKPGQSLLQVRPGSPPALHSTAAESCAALLQKQELMESRDVCIQTKGRAIPK